MWRAIGAARVPLSIHALPELRYGGLRMPYACFPKRLCVMLPATGKGW